VRGVSRTKWTVLGFEASELTSVVKVKIRRGKTKNTCTSSNVREREGKGMEGKPAIFRAVALACTLTGSRNRNVTNFELDLIRHGVTLRMESELGNALGGRADADLRDTR
jgi:hypothetical protein